MRLIVLLGLAVLLVRPADAADPRHVQLGRELAEAGGLGEHSCARCHGALGIGKPAENTPRLAGQPRFYLEKQLEDFAAGLRESEKMQKVARSLSATQRRAVAAYFSVLEFVPYPPPPDGDPLLLQQGGVLSAVGDATREIRACEVCHADAGVGLAPSFPYLAGQYADYTERQLRAWQVRKRRNDPLDVMAEIAKALNDEEIRGLALYFARVRPAPSVVSSAIPAEPIAPPPDAPGLSD